ncbi:MAG: DUF4175 family protein [Deltaproteobacteria bacterium]|nr:DUF4175 family protein [Deltaproteobacteria bacterium]
MVPPEPAQSREDAPVAELVAPREERLRALIVQGEKAQAEVERVLERALSRARTLALGRLTGVALTGVWLSFAGAALLAAQGGALPGRILLAVLTVATLAVTLVFQRRSPLQRATQRAQGKVGLAKVLCAPALGAHSGGSELLSSVELTARPPEGVSLELLSLLHQRAAARAKALPLHVALPANALTRPWLAALLGFMVLIGLIFAAPKRMAAGAARLWGGDEAAALVEAEPIAGDLAITYLYPQYTGLPPRTEEGTAGELKGPKGTEVRMTARADRDVLGAFAVVNGAAQKLETSGKGGRQLSGGFTLATSGRWHLRYTDAKGRTVAEGPDAPLEVTPDGPPQITIEEPAKSEIEVDPQGKLVLQWSANDDYGLTAARLVLQRAGAAEERIPLQSPPEGARAKKMRGAYTWELSSLSLRAGDKVGFYLEALDNDAIDGPQKGVSGTHVIKVFSAAEHHREALLQAQALWERMISLLADRLEETQTAVPQQEEPAKAWYDQRLMRDREGQQLVSDLSITGAKLIKDKLAPKELGRALRNLAIGLNPLVARTAIARVPLQHGANGRDGAVRILATAIGNEVRELEKGVLYLADLLDKARLDDLKELQKDLAASRRELMRLAEQLRKAPDEATKQKILAEVERIRERMQDLMQRMGEMAKGIQDEHLNREAMENVQKEQDVGSQMADVQKKLQAGKIDEALKSIDELARQMEKLEKSLNQQADESMEQKYSEETRKLSEAKEELSRLKDREEKLQQRTSQLRRSQRERAQKKFEQRGGKELARKLMGKVEQAKKQIAQLDPSTMEQTGLDEQMEILQGRTEDLQRALQAGDFEEARDQADRAERASRSVASRLALEEQVQQGRFGSMSRDPVALRKSQQAAQGAMEPLSEVARELQNSLPREGQGMTPEEQREMDAQAQEQGSIKEGFEGVRQKLSEVGKKVPIFTPQHEQTLRESAEGMERAQERLSEHETRGGQAGEEQALEKMGQFEKAMEELAKNGQGGKGGMPIPWGEPGGNESGDGDNEGGDEVNREKVQIPDAESGRPQEFRKKLLDAMKQPPPERFKERVKQYYEELVK